MEIPQEWTFKSKDIANGFDDHVRQQLPWYDLATRAVVHIARHYIPQDGLMYDIGASTGNIGRAMAEIIHSRNVALVSIEESEEMVKKFHAPGQIVQMNALDYDFTGYDFAVCFLVVMFMPIQHRRRFIDLLYKQLNPGGAFVIVDKVNTPDGYPGTVLRRLPMSWKSESGVSCKDIVAKELSLAGHQRPIDPGILPSHAVQFFQMGEFCGWLIEKGECD